MKQSKRLVLLLSITIVLSLLFTVSCGDSGKVRKYKEKTPVAAEKQEKKSPHGSMNVPKPSGGSPMAPGAARAHFKWEAPEGWLEEKGKGGFRLATFTVKSGEQTATCTIIPLAGQAGGLKANVSRWLGQAASNSGHTDPMMAEGDEEAVKKLLKQQETFLTKAQFPAVMIDITPFTKNDGDNSILATMITVSGSTVFVKMTGPKALLVKNKAKFKGLCQSFNMGNPPEPKPPVPAKAH
jgi:hypothetical protein